MSNPVIVAAKLKLKRSALEAKVSEIKEAQERSEALVRAIDDATEEEIETVEKSVEEIQAELTAKEEEKSNLEKEIEALEAELEQSNQKTPNQNENPEGGQRKMKKGNEEIRDGIKAYVRSKGQERAGFTSVEGGALIPEELLKAQEVPTEGIDLAKLVNVVPVTSGSGKYPVIKKSGSKMVSQAELAANPELAKPVITEVAYDIETYRGYIPVSSESIEDADYDVTGMITSEINDQELNTKNFAIASVLKTAPAKAVTGVDGIKTVINKDIKKVYAVKAILSASLFNALDLLKDADGRYLLTPDATVESGKKLFGKEVIVLDDDMIGTADGDLKGFIGDPKAAVTLFDRKRASVKWVDNDVYGELLAGFVRFDVEKTDSEAGFYITYTPAV
ncbi:HK97 family phage major capsid protein [Neobacillus bataviensis]|uniref:HK97 family phage major capsid protein n=1 Tax=Neobacillus bataviensis TaxID=220685 RepID=A0A561DSR7_9BACI|nr:phage major capsid protein [Neobacillus bataviensis]TWE06408.1 HK97 family phage major capsid protein [Neobacillus bataviensis]